jgi:hypothetical protein
MYCVNCGQKMTETGHDEGHWVLFYECESPCKTYSKVELGDRMGGGWDAYYFEKRPFTSQYKKPA